MPECKYCGKPFIKINGMQKYCSRECCDIVTKERVKKTQEEYRQARLPKVKRCECCGEEFTYSGHYRSYCSEDCVKQAKLSNKKKYKKSTKHSSLAAIQKEARERGMSYGQYVAFLQNTHTHNHTHKYKEDN